MLQILKSPRSHIFVRMETGPAVGGDDGSGYIKIPHHRPFDRCPLAAKYDRVKKVGEGTFGFVLHCLLSCLSHMFYIFADYRIIFILNDLTSYISSKVDILSQSLPCVC